MIGDDQLAGAAESRSTLKVVRHDPDSAHLRDKEPHRSSHDTACPIALALARSWDQLQDREHDQSHHERTQTENREAQSSPKQAPIEKVLPRLWRGT